MKYILIKADTNDADYVMEMVKVTDEKLEELLPIIKVISECEAYHNFPNSEYEDDTVDNLYKDKLTQEQINTIMNITPYGENGVHTIVSIKLFEVTSEIELLPTN